MSPKDPPPPLSPPPNKESSRPVWAAFLNKILSLVDGARAPAQPPTIAACPRPRRRSVLPTLKIQLKRFRRPASPAAPTPVLTPKASDRAVVLECRAYPTACTSRGLEYSDWESSEVEIM
ncbi:hypothetical protein BDK51DRAFT_46294 [Blyttiomyces helicus]|uniref:Uncharacterized protein n=1 Tax=Blyttiomyces helicus TaxID=388810 RepID=A0A4P9WED2_9FUNG|nr:hypothetical protein BDK51DRAFT_46294 [Blyttiomyces helicus]|eukprot:RKO91079.1 hypothetical protein BDK51DRAFT_46294 [Blyttiomyces helicus]